MGNSKSKEYDILICVQRGEVNMENLSRLMQQGKDLNKTDKQGETALIKLVKAGNLDAARLLIEHGRVNVQLQEKKFGRDALMFAAWHGHFNIVKYLAERTRPMAPGFDATGLPLNLDPSNYAWVPKKDREHLTSLDLAAMHGHPHIVRFLALERLMVNAQSFPDPLSLSLFYKSALGRAKDKETKEILSLLVEGEKKYQVYYSGAARGKANGKEKTRYIELTPRGIKITSASFIKRKKTESYLWGSETELKIIKDELHVVVNANVTVKLKIAHPNEAALSLGMSIGLVCPSFFAKQLTEAYAARCREYLRARQTDMDDRAKIELKQQELISLEGKAPEPQITKAQLELVAMTTKFNQAHVPPRPEDGSALVQQLEGMCAHLHNQRQPFLNAEANYRAVGNVAQANAARSSADIISVTIDVIQSYVARVRHLDNLVHNPPAAGPGPGGNEQKPQLQDQLAWISTEVEGETEGRANYVFAPGGPADSYRLPPALSPSFEHVNVEGVSEVHTVSNSPPSSYVPITHPITHSNNVYPSLSMSSSVASVVRHDIPATPVSAAALATPSHVRKPTANSLPEPTHARKPTDLTDEEKRMLAAAFPQTYAEEKKAPYPRISDSAFADPSRRLHAEELKYIPTPAQLPADAQSINSIVASESPHVAPVDAAFFGEPGEDVEDDMQPRIFQLPPSAVPEVVITPPVVRSESPQPRIIQLPPVAPDSPKLLAAGGGVKDRTTMSEEEKASILARIEELRERKRQREMAAIQEEESDLAKIQAELEEEEELSKAKIKAKTKSQGRIVLVA